MALQVGIVGLPNVGKSTLFNAVTAAGAEVANYPFATVDPNVGVVPVPDERVHRVAELAGSARAVPTTLEVVDVAGLVRGASHGEGLGNQFLATIREVDAVVHVVRCFEDEGVSHVDGTVDPVRDAEVVEVELLLKDLETVERRLERSARTARTGDAAANAAVEVLEGLKAHLERGRSARSFEADRDAQALLDELFLLSAKPVLFAANVAESDLLDGNEHTAALRAFADERDAEVVEICAQVEAELAELDDPDERAELLGMLGLKQPGLERLVNAAYRLLGLVTFFTANENETRAWTVPAGTTARRAAREIHSDMERGFIRAEVVAYADYDALGGEAGAREAGRLRSEGRDYRVNDGDVIRFRFNV